MLHILHKTLKKMHLSLVIASLLSACSLGFPNPQDPHHDLVGRIIGGEDADIENYPYQLSLENRGFHWCGAAIVSNDWAVTAARFVEWLPPSDVFFRAGSSLRVSGGTLHPASEIVIHPNFRQDPIDFDIAVVKVSTPFTYGPGVGAVALGTVEPVAGEMVLVTGWGFTNTGEGSFASHLQMLSLPIVDREECDQAYRIIGGITETLICAGQIDGGKGVCNTDAGGPAVIAGKLVGIVSRSTICGAAGYPEVYTNVVAVSDFIFNNTMAN